MILSKKAAPFVFLAPTLVLGFLFFVLPLGVSLYLSFTSWNSLGAPRLVGFANYVYLLTRDPLFWGSLRNTLVFVGASTLFGVPLALALALAFRRARFQPFWRGVYWLPMVTNVVAVAYVWQFLLADPYGLVNRTLATLGIAGPAWLFDPDTAMAAIVAVYIWFSVGQDMMLLSAGLEGVDESCEEAAEMDGAGAVAVFRHVTLPLIRPAILLVVMTNLVKGIGFFALMLVMTDGGPVNATNVAALHIYQIAFANLRLGMASAAAWILALAVFAVSLLQLRFMRRGGLEAW